MILKLCDTKEIERIYNEHIVFDFPKAEVKPLSRILHLKEKGLYFVYGLYENEALKCYAFFSGALECDYVLLDYLAVVSGKRGQGIGTKMIDMLKEEICKTKCGFLLESENPDYAENETDRQTRIRRLNFYENCGLEATKMQSRLFGVEYKILVYALKKLSTLSITHAITKLYQALIAEKYMRDNVRLRVKD